jgi:hypothetical protein
MAISKISANMIDGSLTSSLVTGPLPAVDGSALTGAGAGIDTDSTNNPTINTNPSATGHLWSNKTSGEMFICTDATAGANIWINVGGGVGDVAPFHGAGKISGFTVAGYGGAPLAYKATIDKYSFVSDGDATDHGDISGAKSNLAGHSSTTHGYVSAGEPNNNVIEKFPFAGSSVSSTDVGDLSESKYAVTGSSSTTHGYTSGGRNPSSTDLTTIEKFSFSSNGNATDVGDMTVAGRGAGGTHSTTHGYICGGRASGDTNTIDKISFATDGNATDMANLTVARHGIDTSCSETHGYCHGGHAGNFVNTIDKFSFAAGSNSTDVGDLTFARYFCSGTSSTTHGYTAGGYSGAYNDIIEKFAFATDGNGVDSTGNLTDTNYGCSSGSVQY